MRTNRETIDDTARQKLSMSEIEALKREETGSGKELIAKILESHSALDQKTSFGLAKYTLRKAKKYLRRFTVLPLDVTLLANWILYEKDPGKIMEIREEILAIICSWSNVHYGLESPSTPKESRMRWLVVDETGGLIVAAMAERMGILYPNEDQEHIPKQNGAPIAIDVTQPPKDSEELSNNILKSTEQQNNMMSADTNTITLIHANTQPNLSLLSYFDFDPTSPLYSHPLYSHLKTLSWLQLLSPHEDSTYIEPELIPEEELANLKSGKRGNYYRKRRRWERVKSVVDETRAGGFDGLVIASVMNPTTILHHVVPLLRGAAQVIVYSPSIEPLMELADFYSPARRAAYLTDPPHELPSDDFPLNPTLLLTPAIHTVRCRPWQVLPGRTHPLMTGRGGAEGYVFVGTRVIPVEGKIEGRGQYKRRKLADTSAASPAGEQSNHIKEEDHDMKEKDHADTTKTPS
jgi:tRNA (adenine-N(1)-)-methyltransferase non-catalytic subunit